MAQSLAVRGDDALAPVVRSVLLLAAGCGMMTKEELDEVAASTVEGQTRRSLERLASVASWASKLLLAESRRRP